MKALRNASIIVRTVHPALKGHENIKVGYITNFLQYVQLNLIFDFCIYWYFPLIRTFLTASI